MKRFWLAMAMVLACSAACAQEVSSSACYNKAATEVEYVACLKSELADLDKQYDAVVDKVMSQMRAEDRAQKNKRSTEAFTEANKSFQTYVKDECDWQELLSGNAAGTNAAGLSCRINMTRLRLGAMQHQFLQAP